MTGAAVLALCIWLWLVGRDVEKAIDRHTAEQRRIASALEALLALAKRGQR